MPFQKEIKIFNIGRTAPVQEEIRKWLDEVGAVGYDVPDAATPCDTIIGLAAKRCYMSFEKGLNPNVTKVRKDWFEYLGNVLKSGHGSVTEHSTYNFAIENITRVATAELNRHRAGVAISEGSMRYIRFDKIPYWVPFMLRPAEGDAPDLVAKKVASIEVFERSFGQAEVNYSDLMSIWDIENPEMPFAEKKILTSMFRRTVPMGVCTGGIWTFNFRSLRHVIALRSDPHAEEEISYVLTVVGKIMVDNEPNLFQDFEQTPDGFWVPKHRKV